MDKQYWWHNLLLLDGELERFHYPFKPEHGDAAAYVYERIHPWLGRRVLEVGCGTGWLRRAWHIEDYTGIEKNGFREPFQAKARALAAANGVLHTSLSDFLDANTRQFDTVVCYESFHAFPQEVLAAARGPLLKTTGTLVIVDAQAWWPQGVALDSGGLETIFEEEIPARFFDLARIASASIDLIERLIEVGHSRAEVLAAAEYHVQPQVYHPLRAGAAFRALRRRLQSAPLEPPSGLRYRIVVARKTAGAAS